MTSFIFTNLKLILMKRKIFTLLALAVVSFGVANAAKNLTIKKTATAPVADADAADWTGTWVDLAESKATTSDMKAKFQMTYNDSKLFIILEITDATANNDATAIPNSWERDCNETFIDMDTTVGDTKYKAGTWQLRMQRTASDGSLGSVGVDGTNTALLTADAGFKVASSGDASPYYIEWELPWKVLKSTAAWDCKQFKFDIAAADNTTAAASGRTQQLFWDNNSDAQWNNTSKFGLVTMETKVDTLAAVNNVTKASASAYVVRNVLNVNGTSGVVNVFDLTGKVVLKSTVKGSASISLAGLKPGVYVVRGNNLTSKIMVR